MQTIGVVGAGTMGRGSAQTIICAGMGVVLMDISHTALAESVEQIGAGLDRLVKRWNITLDQRNQALCLLSTSTEYESLRIASVVTEAATENVELKK